MPDSGSLHFGERHQQGKIKTVHNSVTGSVFPPITNREFKEVNQYIFDNSQDGASIPVEVHLQALFQVPTEKRLDPDNPQLCTIHMVAGIGYSKERFDADINTAVQFGYTVVEQDSPLRSWKIYYMSLGNNVYCATYSTTFRRVTVTSRV